jgi:hypothetical protein
MTIKDFDAKNEKEKKTITQRRKREWRRRRNDTRRPSKLESKTNTSVLISR